MPQQNIPIHDFTRDDASSISFMVEKLEKKEDYDTTLPHRHNYYEIFFFERGGGSHEVDFEVLPITDYSLRFVSPGQVHLLQRELDSNGYVIFFSRDFYYLNLQNRDLLFDMPFFNNNSRHPALELPPADRPVLIDLIHRIREEAESSNSFKEELLRSYLNVLLIQCQRIFNTQQDSSPASGRGSGGTFREFRVLLENNFTKLHQVADYADLLAITPSHLNESCKKASGQTASEMIHDRIILEAKRLLLHSELNAKEIGYFLNFDDPSYFNRFFKKKTGQQPGAFRKSVREQYES